MERLYYEDQYIKEFTAEIVEVKEVNAEYHIVLDKTAFYPGGGGQACDLGKIGDSEIIDVFEVEGVIYHVTKKKPIKIHKVKCVLDWERRFDGMQQHLAQHVLSGCFYTLFNANTVGIHLGKDISTVDIEGYLDEEKIREAERFANEVILKNYKISYLTPTKSELKKLKLRRALPNTKEDIRVVMIDELDINACCGVHANSTLELQLLKIKKFEKNKGATRIEYIAGSRAVKDSFSKDMFTNDVCKYLNCGESDAINTIKNLSEQVKELMDSNKKLNVELSEYKIKEMIESSSKVKDTYIVKEIYEDKDIKQISKIATKIVEENNAIVLFANKSGERVNLVFASSKNLKKVSMNDLLKDTLTLVDGKGGGSPFLAQGAGKNNNNVDSAMDYAYMKIKNLI